MEKTAVVFIIIAITAFLSVFVVAFTFKTFPDVFMTYQPEDAINSELYK